MAKGFSDLRHQPSKGAYIDQCERTGNYCWSTDMVTDEYGVRCHKDHALRKSVSEKPFTIPQDKFPRKINDLGTARLPYRCFLIRDNNNTVIDVFCGYYGDITSFESATTTQVQFYQPSVSDQTFTINYFDTVAGTVSATVSSGYTLVYAIDSGNDDGLFEIDSSTGVITVVGTIEEGESYALVVSVTSDSLGSLSDTATVTVEVADFDLTDYGTLKLWLDSQDTDTIPATLGNPVSLWLDKSGNGYDFTSSGSNRPVYTAAAISSLYPAMAFDGTNDFFASDEPAATWNFLHDGTVDYAVFIVLVRDQSATNNDSRRPLNTGDNSNRGIDVIVWDSDGSTANAAQFEVNKAGGSNVVTCTSSASTITTATPHVLSFGLAENGDGTNDAYLYVDGVLVASDDRGAVAYETSDANHTLNIGCPSSGSTASSFWDGYIAEVIIIEGTLTDNQHEEIYDFLANKWGM
jgi:hypothetical protein